MEKKVFENLTHLGFHCYLPLVTTIRQWSDRRKKINIPLFPNYVFIRIDAKERTKVFSVKGILKFVSIDRAPAIVSDKDILLIKKVTADGDDVLPHEYFVEGMKVKVLFGPLEGLEGIVHSGFNKDRLVIRINSLMKAFSFIIPSCFLAEIKGSETLIEVKR